MCNFLKLILFFFVPANVFADRQVGLGGLASNLMGPVSVASDFMHAGCFVIGASFIFASIIRYIEHRKSPTMVPFSTIVFLLVGGLFLIAIPIFTK